MAKYEIRDAIYGFISINEWEREIINTPAFQRLRRIKQLALTDFVYPGANHTRFEHSLGVMHLASLMYKSIVSNDENKKLLKEKLSYNDSGIKKDHQLIRLAALLHDVGHAPFSHVSEELMPHNKKKGKPYKHENYSSAIVLGPLKDIIENHNLNINNYGIRADEVAALIEANPDVLKDRIFWKVIISSQLDADRGDYLLRDSHHLGVKYGIYDYERLINTISLGIDPESLTIVLGTSKDGLHTAEALVIARYQMFNQVYFHKTRRAYDYHLTESMKKVLGKKKLPPPNRIDDYLEIDDYKMLHEIRLRKSDYNCRCIIERNHMRDIYSSSDTPSLKAEKDMEKKLKILQNNSMWCYMDRSSNLWYRLNTKGEESKEIMIIDDNKNVKPLSEYSNVVKNLGEIQKMRIYVKPNDRDKAKRLIKVN